MLIAGRFDDRLAIIHILLQPTKYDRLLIAGQAGITNHVGEKDVRGKQRRDRRRHGDYRNVSPSYGNPFSAEISSSAVREKQFVRLVERLSRRGLRKSINFDQADAGAASLPGDDRGVGAGAERLEQGRLEIILRRETGRFDISLVCVFPVVIAGNEDPVLVAEFEGRIGPGYFPLRQQ